MPVDLVAWSQTVGRLLDDDGKWCLGIAALEKMPPENET